MYKIITRDEFCKAFKDYDNFTPAALRSIYDYLTSLEGNADISDPIELDVIAICCEYIEYANLQEFNEEMNKECETLDDVREHTAVIEVEGSKEGFVIQNF